MTEETNLSEMNYEMFPELSAITKCNECPIMWVCDKYKKSSRCHFELMRLKVSTQKGRYLSSTDQKKFLAEIEENLSKYEQIIKYNAKPMKKDLIKLINMKLQLYDIVYNGKTQMATNIQINNNSSSMDIKKVMDSLREEEKMINIEGKEKEEVTMNVKEEEQGESTI
jgi:hypothetical protein